MNNLHLSMYNEAKSRWHKWNNLKLSVKHRSFILNEACYYYKLMKGIHHNDYIHCLSVRECNNIFSNRSVK